MGGDLKFKSAEDCPDIAKHSKFKDEPHGYLGWHEWAEKKGGTHDQLRCPACGFYAIWKRRAD